MRVHRVASYRIQLRPEFGFDKARAQVDYLASLGISHLYASPYLQAAKGSAHGYDVVDHSQVNQELGGEQGRRSLCAALSARHMGQLLDIVPNHMAIRGGHNAWWHDVLENGPASAYSSYFDVEWQAAVQDRVLLPLLGDQYGIELEAGKIVLKREDAQFAIRYYEHRTPVAPRSLGTILRDAARNAGSEALAFVADAFVELPLPTAPDKKSRRRRHRDKRVLQSWLERLLREHEDLAEAVDAVLVQINDDPDRLHDVLEHQNYRLAYWRVGNHELDYRRFFDIDSLVGLRVEDDEVFDDTHQLPLAWLSDESIDGLRIDHIDGLYDPTAYLARLREHAPHAWLLVEKILEGDEQLPGFPVEGTTGYDFLNHVQRLLVDSRGEPALSELHRELNPEFDDIERLVRECKRLVLKQALASDLQRLTERLTQICYSQRRYRDFSRVELSDALRELCVAFPVYRSYARPEATRLGPADRDVLARAISGARELNPTLDGRLFEFLEQLLSLEWPGEAEREFVMRWQQVTGPTMAKGLEDTAFYRHARLVALNEVGGDPERFAETAADFHAWVQGRSAHQSCPLNTTSTHDTKRSEDVRARLLVLSEVPEQWREAITRWRVRLQSVRPACPPLHLDQVPEPALEYFLLQNLVGAWPIEKERVLEFARKAMREAKRYTSWHHPNEDYENAVCGYLERVYEDKELVEDLGAFVASISDAGYANSLNQLALKVLCPGVPDIYQGSELWDFSLVDPDNRRPVDYGRRRRLLEVVGSRTPSELWAKRADGGVKLYFLRQLLALRARQPRAFDPGSPYEPLAATGRGQDRVVAFLRGSSVLAVATRFYARDGADFADTELQLPAGSWSSVLVPGATFSGTLPLGELLGPFPTAVLERASGGQAK